MVGVIILLIVLLNSDISSWRKITTIDVIAHNSKIVLFIVFILSMIYAFISVFAYEDTLSSQKINTAITSKYEINLTDKQKDELFQYDDALDDGKQLYSTGSTIIDGKEVIAIWKNNEIFLLEFKNGQWVEFQP